MDGWGALTLLAPAIAIGTAWKTKRVMLSLSMGIVVGMVVAVALGAGGSVEVVSIVARDTIWSIDHITITVFSMFVAGMVGVLDHTGMMADMVKGLDRWVKTPRAAMVASWCAGWGIFFDDYANCMVVGSAMGPVCDEHKVSRAKLAYIVDSTAAPIASLTLISTWVGYEIDVLNKALETVDRAGEGFEIFLSAIPYRFYGWLALILALMVATSGRDFGPMLREESLARHGPDPKVTEHAATGKAWRALIPVLALILVTFGSMYAQGIRENAGADVPLWQIIGAANPFSSMLNGSIVGLTLALVMGAASGSRAEAMSGMLDGFKKLLPAMAVLYLAWALGSAITLSGAQEYLTGLLGGWFPGWALPLVTFCAAAITAFSTGTSFATMGILIPLVVPLGVTLVPEHVEFLLPATVGAVLAGAIWGDHASPISDTTVLSATGARVDLVTHVETQLPYAMLAGVTAALIGYLPAGFGFRPFLSIGIGVVVMGAVLLWRGKHPEDVVMAEGASSAPSAREF